MMRELLVLAPLLVLGVSVAVVVCSERKRVSEIRLGDFVVRLDALRDGRSSEESEQDLSED